MKKINFKKMYIFGIILLIFMLAVDTKALENNNKILGDINGDGELTEEDVILLGRLYMSGSEVDLSVADIDGDGKLNNADVILLGRKINAKKILGDINGDGELTEEDVILLGRLYMSGSEVDLSVADIDGDGKLNNADVILLGRKLDMNINNLLIEKVSNGIIMRASNDILSEEINLKVVKLDDNQINKSIKNISNKYTGYDISLLDLNNKKVQPNGKVSISLPIPRDYNKNNLAVYYVDDDGNLTKLDISVKEDYVEFETDHFSNYILLETNIENPKTSDFSSDIFIISAIGCLIALSILLIKFNTKKVKPNI